MRAQCTIFQPPRLITGRPATSTASTPRTLVVDIIVLNSGHVEDPFIIEGGDPSLDDDVLEMISGWRYRPAMCDGNPIEAEGRIQVRLESSLTTATPKSE
jgi:TonB family protein